MARSTGSLGIPTPARVAEILKYDPETGLFCSVNSEVHARWREGQPRGSLNKSTGYIHLTIDGHEFTAQRIAVVLMLGHWPENIVDHRNRNKSDNRWANLREGTQSQNAINTKISSKNTSGVKGVYLFTDRRKSPPRTAWGAYIGNGDKRKNIGYFKTIEEAAEARRLVELEIYGEFSPQSIDGGLAESLRRVARPHYGVGDPDGRAD